MPKRKLKSTPSTASSTTTKKPTKPTRQSRPRLHKKPVLVDLPDIVFFAIYDLLPVWQILQLANLCHRLNYIKDEVCRKRSRLRILGGCLLDRLHIDAGKRAMRFHGIESQFTGYEDDFDLTLKFGFSYPCKHDAKRIELTPDLNIIKLELIRKFGRVFPNVKQLTLVLGSNWPTGFKATMLANWPELTQLHLISLNNHFVNYAEEVSQLNRLTSLEKLTLHCKLFNPGEVLAGLLQNGRRSLKSISIQDCVTMMMVPRLDPATNMTTFDEIYQRGQWNESWNRRELDQPLHRLREFALYDYDLNRAPITEQRLIEKCTRLSATMDRGFNLMSWDNTNWNALQYLNLRITNNVGPLTDLFEQLEYFRNLIELRIESKNFDHPFKVPLESEARRLPVLPSVRTFRLDTRMEPHQLYRFKYALPNATQLSLEMCLPSPFDPESRWAYYAKNVLCDSCQNDVKYAHKEHGEDNINRFEWIYNRKLVDKNENGDDDDGKNDELIANVELHWKVVAGRFRLSHGLTPIVQKVNRYAFRKSSRTPKKS